MRLTPLPDGTHRIEMLTAAVNATPAWTTRYPPELISQIHATKGVYTCDEIMREEDPRYVERAIRHEVLSYVDAAQFAGKRLLDFGCGAGASTLVMSRLLPGCEIVGIELQERLLRLAKLRAERLGRAGLSFMLSPSGGALPEGIGVFDYIVLSAVFEHLLPDERAAQLPLLWRRLKRGGVLFINQTPHRWSPVEMHTTGLPLINYLPSRAAFQLTKLARRLPRQDDDWNALLRAGIRGATVGEILDLLRHHGAPELLAPKVGDPIDLWHGKLSRRRAWLKRGAWALLKALRPLGGARLVPELTLAIRKSS